ncbi:aldehyde dehydrogenase [Morchella conica CCBAS932]|uniref:Aldehyde dehydrogenase n=1 Tax=Morchella conica CCBAS932 TaxID=1392247 RepID=A0A3N4L777_9PEZI|nr:aldehyde dehydrogenase [Morchella conica CCBAS932]
MTLSDPTYITPFIVNNKPYTTTKTFTVRNPSSPTTTLWKASSATLECVEEATKAATAAFPKWAATKIVKRQQLLHKVADILDNEGSELRECLEIETAANGPWVDFNMSTAAELTRRVAGELAGIEGSVPDVQAPGRAAMIVKEPLGVVLAIIPWNAPIVLLVRGILYAVGAGNTVIIKSSELSPRTHFILTSLIISAGFPPGVINLIGHCREDAAEITEALISQRAIRKVSFTGSAAIGKRIAALCGEHLKPVVMELGGKSPLILFEDVNIEEAAASSAFGALAYAGQVCMSTDKIIVHSSIADAFEKAFLAASAMFGTSQTLLHPDAPRRVKELVDSAAAAGAKIVNQEAYDSFNFESGGNSFPNLLLRGVTDKMDLYHQESFGPIASLFVVDDEEEAIRIANDTVYGLVGSVWSKDLRRALRVAKKLQTGLITINGATLSWEAQLQFHGVKDSGFGRDSLDSYLTPKVITYDI